jgi:hypothetical protein
MFCNYCGAPNPDVSICSNTSANLVSRFEFDAVFVWTESLAKRRLGLSESNSSFLVFSVHLSEKRAKSLPQVQPPQHRFPRLQQV